MSEIHLNSEPKVDLATSLADVASGGTSSLVNVRRRRLAKFAVGGPVLVTLASRPAFAGKCLSNMLSGNLSDPNRGNCSKGWSPGGWGLPGGQVHTYSTIGAWTAIGFAYGTLTPGASYSQLASYTGGATIATLASMGVGVLNKNSVASDVTLREVLAVDPSSRQLTRHLVCAYFNALLSDLSGSTFHYILTPQQVLGLAGGTISLPPGYSDLQSFLGSTW